MAGGTLAAARQIVQACRRLYERGLIAGPDGNVSVRLSETRILATPAGMSKIDVGVRDLVEVEMGAGTRNAGRGTAHAARGTSHAARSTRHKGGRLPSSEIAMHFRIYQRRPDVRAVVHAHPPTATGFAVAGEDFMAGVLPEVILQMGGVPLVPYATPGTEALPDAMEPFLAHHEAFLLANHGATTVGASLTIALQRMESLEHAARIMLAARTLGRVQSLTARQVGALRNRGSE